LVGALAWLVDFLTFVLTYPSVGVIWAQTAARGLGAAVGFVGHKYLVFGDRRGARRLVVWQTLQYLLLWGLSYGLSVGGIVWLVERQGMAPVAAKIVVEAGVLVLNFTVMKRVIFSK
jgi:putative flippase GtrA